ncbi:MAG: DNA processing protein DprA [Comamonadaceae bacterium BICA1-1]|nr:MAG: DNA processing protein DprA [Comamonadaceae bacterium BICA1-1]
MATTLPAPKNPGSSAAAETAELAAWLRLTTTAGVGAATARKLLAAFGSPEAVFAAAPAAREALLGPRLAPALASAPVHLERVLAQTLGWLAVAPDRHLLTLGSPHYPAALLQTPDPPVLLYAQGQLSALAQPCTLAMVGSRNPSPQGAENAHAFAKALGAQGFCIVSGLALGVDGAAHRGALEVGAATVAVVGTGLDRVYPRQNHELAQRIAAHGILISEYPLGTPPLAPHFPQRNRIIAGLSLGTLVVEAALESGSLITAELAAQYGREVFAIPGSIHAPQSRGCHALIRQGAKLVESVQDVLDELRPAHSVRAPVQSELALGEPSAAQPAPRAKLGQGVQGQLPHAEAEGALLQALGYDPVGLDALQARCGLPIAELQAQLLEFELLGAVRRLPGGLFQRLGRA